MLRDGDVALIRSSPLFAGMSEREVASVIAACDEHVFAAGHRVVVEGMEGHDFFIILAGEAAVAVDGRVVARLGPGEFFGEAAPLRHVPRSASVVALAQLRCLSLVNDALGAVLEEHPRLTYNMLLGMVDRLRATDVKMRAIGRPGVGPLSPWGDAA